MSDQNCPICNDIVESNIRYPKYICAQCLTDGVEINAKQVALVDLGVYSKGDISCRVNGTECIAKEARFGGVVVQPI
jgi:hypothetical protein